ncbi:transketolase family protein [Candidatus Fermentibacteria bacterium]|nr:transketolase family protein [Candidatus Fermentibacteria bacterium]
MPGNRLKATREGYVEGLLEAGRRDQRVVVLDADVSRSIGSIRFAEEFPDRAFNVGVSEQDMMAEAAGLALAGYVPFVGTYGVFVVGRAWDQLRTSVCYMGLDVKVGGAHAGVSVGPDGATHQALEDIALTRVLPGMKVLTPADSNQTRAAVMEALRLDGPVYVRFGRNPVPQIYPGDVELTAGKADVLEEGDDVALVACGVMVSEAMQARKMLFKKGIRAEVVNMTSVKPLDEEVLIDAARRTGRLVVAEDHQNHGGLYGAVSELICRSHPAAMASIAVGDSFGTSGSPRQVRSEYGLTAGAIAARAESLMEGKR